MSVDREIDTCTGCLKAIYLNVQSNRSVKSWVHRATGAKFCDRTETGVATPGGVSS